MAVGSFLIYSSINLSINLRKYVIENRQFLHMKPLEFLAQHSANFSRKHFISIFLQMYMHVQYLYYVYSIKWVEIQH